MADSTQQQQVAEQQSIDYLSHLSNELVCLILQRVPANHLLKACVLVSQRWNQLLASNAFWKDKPEYDGYPRPFDGFSLYTYQNIAIRRPFGRNFVRDTWDLGKKGVDAYKPDKRWYFEHPWGAALISARIEKPPRLLDGPKPEPDTGEEVPACIAASDDLHRKCFLIKLEDEGLTDELMDTFRPTIVVSELVTNRRDCASFYAMYSRLLTNESDQQIRHYNSEPVNGDGVQVLSIERKRECLTKLMFRQWEEEKWRKVEHVFDKYPAGMRYLRVDINGACKSGHLAGNYVPKMAKFEVRALNKSNNARV